MTDNVVEHGGNVHLSGWDLVPAEQESDKDEQQDIVSSAT